MVCNESFYHNYESNQDLIFSSFSPVFLHQILKPKYSLVFISYLKFKPKFGGSTELFKYKSSLFNYLEHNCFDFD